MECKQFQEIAQDLARDQIRDRARVDVALAHAESCPHCDSLLEGEEALTRALRALAALDVSASAPDRVRDHLLLALARQRRPAGRAAGISSLAGNAWGWAGAAITAATAAALLFISMAPRTAPVVPLPSSSVIAAASFTRPAGRHRAFGTTIPVAASLASSTAPAQNQWASAFAGDETDTQPFVPLSESFDPASLGDDTVVRVVVPRETLQSLGVSLDEDANEQVVADVIVTTDGTPQAVRVLSW